MYKRGKGLFPWYAVFHLKENGHNWFRILFLINQVLLSLTEFFAGGLITPITSVSGFFF